MEGGLRPVMAKAELKTEKPLTIQRKEQAVNAALFAWRLTACHRGLNPALG